MKMERRAARTRNRMPSPWIGCALALVVAAGLGATGRGPAPSVTYKGVTASFRGAANDVPSATDAILGDGYPYAGNPLAPSFGAFFVTYRNSTLDDFSLMLDGTGGRFLVLDFSTRLVAPSCGSACRWSSSFQSPLPISRTLGSQGLLVRPVDSNGYLLNGMAGIAIGQTVPANLKLNFPDPDGRVLWWTLRYNATDYPGSSYAYVTRISATAWTIEAGDRLTDSDVATAELVASPDGSANSRKQTHEGFYYMPFSITVRK